MTWLLVALALVVGVPVMGVGVAAFRSFGSFREVAGGLALTLLGLATLMVGMDTAMGSPVLPPWMLLVLVVVYAVSGVVILTWAARAEEPRPRMRPRHAQGIEPRFDDGSPGPMEKAAPFIVAGVLLAFSAGLIVAWFSTAS